MKTAIMKKILITVLAITLCILCAVLFLNKNVNAAYAGEEENFESLSLAIYVDGISAESDITIKRGESVTFNIFVKDITYTPILYSPNNDYAFSIKENVFTLLSNSKTGGAITLYLDVMIDSVSIIETVIIVPELEDDFADNINIQESDGILTVGFADSDIVSIYADVKMQEQGIISALITDSDSLKDILDVSQNGIYGLTFDIKAVTYSTLNNDGTASIHSVANGTNNLELLLFRLLL